MSAFPLSAYTRLCLSLPGRFSSVDWRRWGLLFRNPFNPSCHDANHAVILDLSCDFSEALEEIEGHYSRRLIAPRIHSGFVLGEEERLLPFLLEHGWSVEYSQAKVFLQTGPCPPPPFGFAFERPKELTSEVVSLLLSEGGEWSLGVAEYLLCHPECGAFAARAADGTLASFLYILWGHGCAVIQGVVTLPDYRKRGLGYGLLCAAIEEFRKSWPNTPLFLEAESQNAIRLYERAGFARIEAPRRWSACKSLTKAV